MNWYKRTILSQIVEQLANPVVEEQSPFTPQQEPQEPQEQEDFQFPEKEDLDPNLPSEKRRASTAPDIRQWVLMSFRKLRRDKVPQGKDVYLLDEILSLPESVKYWDFESKIDDIVHWQKNVKVNLNSYSPEQAMDESDEWHKILNDRREGVGYESTERSTIVYGPKWQTPGWEGWTIQKVTNRNDLFAEENKMHHPDGSYTDSSQQGNSVIYSLRDPYNEPHVTMEIGGERDYVPGSIKQILGHYNSEPNQRHRRMIREWMTISAEKSGIVKEINAFEDLQKYINEDQGVSKIISSINKILKGEENEYGLQYILNYNMNKIIDGVIAANESDNIHNFQQFSTYSSEFGNAPSYIVNLALVQDLKLSRLPDHSDEWVELKRSPKISDWKHMIEISNWADNIIREIMEVKGGWGPADIGIVPVDRSDYESSEEYNQALKEHYEDETLIYKEILTGSIEGEFAENLLEEIEKLRKNGFVPNKEKLTEQKEQKEIKERRKIKKSPSHQKGIEKGRQRIRDVLRRGRGKSWYKKAIEEIEGMDVPGYGYHGAPIEKLAGITINGLNAGSWFASNEEDTSQYADGLWLRFPFPSNYEKRIGMGDYFTAIDAIPTDMIEFKTGMWEEWEPLK